MSHLKDIEDLFKSSSFYKKYKNTYCSDIILRQVFESNIPINRYFGITSKSYEEIHRLNVNVLSDLYYKFAREVDFNDEKIYGKMIKVVCIDPDSHAVRKLKEIECTADALFSIARIYTKYKIDIKTVKEYEIYRKKPIFFFPRERNGINMKRCQVFGDKIDHTLYDIKMYLDAKTEEERNNCKLICAYNLPKTKKWLEEIGTFEKLVEWYGIKGIFVNDNYDVFDIEKGQSEIISGYLDKYKWEDWSESYYNNLKEYVNQFMSKK